MSGEMLDSEKAAIKRLVPQVWVFIKNKSISTTINHDKKKENRNASGINDAKLEDFPEYFYPLNVVAFRAFRNYPITAQMADGTASSSAIYLDKNVDSLKHKLKSCNEQRHEEKSVKRQAGRHWRLWPKWA